MSKYTGLLFPVEEYYPIGPFRFPVYHDLVPGEARGIEEVARAQSKTTYKSLKLAQRIAKAKKVPVKEVVEMMSKGAEGPDQDLLYNYAEELDGLSSEGLSQTDQMAQFATLALRYRGEVKMPNSTQWEKTADWSDEDTNTIPTKILKQIFDFVIWERDGWPEDQAKNEDSSKSLPPKTS